MSLIKLRFVILSLLLGPLCSAALTAGPAVDPGRPQAGDTRLQTTLNELLGEEQAARYKKFISPKKRISWQVYLPDNDSGEIPGVLVYVSPRRTGEIDPRWRAVLDEQNLIYISADKSDNRVPSARRMVMALMGLRILEKHYVFSADRIFVSGFSGGGKVASILASQYPEVFSGALYICGVDFWKTEEQHKIDRLVQNRFVFLTGTRDFNLPGTRHVYDRYLEAGANNSKLMVIPGLEHLHPDAEHFAEAMAFLTGSQSE